REDQDRLRDPAYPPLLRLQAPAPAGGDRRRDQGAGKGDPGPAGRGYRVSFRATSLKRVTQLVAGGTPSVDEPRFWSEDSGTPWVTISDMTRQPAVQQTERRLTKEGIASKRLPVGRKGTVLFAMYASVGAVSVLETEASWNQAILGMEP